MFGFRSGASVAGPRQDGPPARPAEVMAPRRCCRYRNNLICLDDALSPAPPLSAEDARTILAKLRPELDRSDETGAAVVLIGGQAVLFWQRQLGTGDDPDGIVETRGDIDFVVADRDVVEHCAEFLGGRARFADPFNASPELRRSIRRRRRLLCQHG